MSDLGRLRDLVRAARLYYEENLSEREIAVSLGTSRSTVSRMLAEAKRRGIVKISFASGNTAGSGAGSELQRAFGLKDLVLVPAIDGGGDARLKERLGAAAASYLSEVIRPGHKVGISWGTTLFEVALRLRPARIPGVCVVQLNGCVGQGGASYLGAQVLQMIATKLGAKALSFPAPAIVQDPALSEAFSKDPSIAEALEIARGSDVAVFTVGVVDPACVLVGAGYLTPEDMKNLQIRGAVGDICSRFFDSLGRICDPTLDKRTLGLSLSNLATIPLKITVAGGGQKVAGILGAIRAGYVDVLITDETTARDVMNLARHQAPSVNQVRVNARTDSETPLGGVALL
ncbi:MAG: sugar-binding transcriptional regulator [Bacillota bacterium]